jgi:ketopantoate reductase
VLRVAVIGIGAIGGPLAAHLVEANLSDVDVIAVTKHPELAETLQTKGLQLQGVEEPRMVQMKAVPLIENLEGHFEIVFLAMKAMEVETAAKALLPFLREWHRGRYGRRNPGTIAGDWRRRGLGIDDDRPWDC